jgi:hypothetical protein
MAQRNIDYGAYPDDGNANSIRDAFIATQDNFTELFNQPQAGVSQIVGGAGITLYNASGVAQAQLAGNVNVSANIYKITFQAGDPANPASLGAQFLTFNGNTTATIESTNPGTIPDVILDISPNFLANFQVANLYVSNKALIGNDSIIYSNLFPPLTVTGGNTGNNIPTGNIVVDHVKATPLGRFIGNVSLQDTPYTNVGGVIYNDLSPVPFLASQGIQVLTSDPDFYRYDSANFNLLVPNVTTNNITVLGNINGNFTGNISGNVSVTGLDRGLVVKSGSGLTTTSTTANSINTTFANAALTGDTIITVTSITGITAGQVVTSSVSGLLDSDVTVVDRWTGNNNVQLSSALLTNANIGDPLTFTTLTGFVRYTTAGVLQTISTPIAAIGSNLTISAGGGITLSNTASNLLVLSNNSTFGMGTGSLRVQGGAAITQALNVGANINANSLNIGNDTPIGNLGVFTVSSTGIVQTENNSAVDYNNPLNSGALQVAGGASFANNIYVGSPTNSSNLATGAMRVVGGMSVGNSLNVGNNISGYTLEIGVNAPNGSSGNFGVTQSGVVSVFAVNSGNYTDANYSITTSGGIQANKDVFVKGTTVSTDTQTGALVVVGGVGIGGNLNVAGDVNLSSTTNSVTIGSTIDSSNSSNGAFTVAGGVGIAKRLHVGTSVATDALYIGNNAGNSGYASGILTIDTSGNILTTSSSVAILPNNASNLGIGLEANVIRFGGVNSTTILVSPTLVSPAGQTQQFLFETVTEVMNFAGTATTLNMGANSGNAILRNPTLVGTQATQNVYNSNATTVNAFGAATTLNIGQNSGTATLRNPTLVGVEATQNVYNTIASTVNAFGDATGLNIGANSGTATLRNPTLVGTESTQNVYNTTATTVNAFGAATAMNIGATNSTLTLRSNTVVGETGQINQNLFNTIATTVNAFGQASTINLANSADTTINIGNGGATGVVKIFGTQNATNNNYTSGALQVSGGVGIAKDVYIGGNLYLVGSNSNGTISNTKIEVQNTNDSLNALDTGASISTTGGVSVAKGLNVGTNIRSNYIGVGGNAGINGSGETISLFGDSSTSNIDTTSATFNVADTTAGTVNIGSAATSINMGVNSAGSKLTIRNGNVIGANSTQSLFDGVATTMNFARAATSITMGAVAGTMTLQNPTIVGSQATQNAFNTVASTMNFAGQASNLNMGLNSGTATLRNPTLVGTETTQNVYNTTATTVNAFGAASNLNIGLNSGTATLRNPTLVGTETTQNVYNSTATTVNAFGAATSLNLGATSGTMTVNNPTLVGTQTTQNVFNATATTVNAFGAATSLNVGATSGTMTVNNPTLVGTQTTQNVFNTTATTVNAFGAATSLNLGQNSGTATLRNPTLVGTEATQNVFNTTATTVNAFGAATSLNVGATSGTMTVNNPTLVGTQTTQNVYNTTATTVNSFGAASSLNMGANSGTATLRNPTLVGTETTQNVYNSVATTVNAFGAATTLIIGASTGTANIQNQTVNIPNGNLVVGGATANIVGNAIIGGNANINGAELYVSGNANVAGNLKVTNNITADNFWATNNGGSGINYRVGDDIYLGDVNLSDTLGLRGQQSSGSSAYINFGSGDTKVLGRSGTGPLTYTGNFTVNETFTNRDITTGGSSTSGNLTGNWTLTSGSQLQATYSDLAEYYAGDAPIEKGRVVEIGGSAEVTICNTYMSTRVAGIVTTEPAYVMNSLNNYEHPICIALAGRVPVKVRGKIRKGDMLVSSLHGCATATDNPTVGTVIGKALQNYDSTEEGTIEVMIGRN